MWFTPVWSVVRLNSSFAAFGAAYYILPQLKINCHEFLTHELFFTQKFPNLRYVILSRFCTADKSFVQWWYQTLLLYCEGSETPDYLQAWLHLAYFNTSPPQGLSPSRPTALSQVLLPTSEPSSAQHLGPSALVKCSPQHPGQGRRAAISSPEISRCKALPSWPCSHGL